MPRLAALKDPHWSGQLFLVHSRGPKFDAKGSLRLSIVVIDGLVPLPPGYPQRLTGRELMDRRQRWYFDGPGPWPGVIEVPSTRRGAAQ